MKLTNEELQKIIKKETKRALLIEAVEQVLQKDVKIIIEETMSEAGRRRNEFGDLEGSNEERWNKEAGRYDVEYSDRQWKEAERTGMKPWQIPDDEHHEWQKGEDARSSRERAEYAEWLKTPEGQRSQMRGTEAEEWDIAQANAERERRGKPADTSKLAAAEKKAFIKKHGSAAWYDRLRAKEDAARSEKDAAASATANKKAEQDTLSQVMLKVFTAAQEKGVAAPELAAIEAQKIWQNADASKRKRILQRLGIEGGVE